MEVTEGWDGMEWKAGMEISLLNEDCKTLSSPEMCPNTWQYIDENFELQIDIELKIECGKF